MGTALSAVVVPGGTLHVILAGSELKGVGEMRRGDLRTDEGTKVRVPGGDNAPTLGALVVRVFTVVVRMLSAVAPPTSLPEGALL